MDINVIIASTVGLFVITLLLVTMLLVAKEKLLPSGPVKLVINGEKDVEVSSGDTLLTTLGNNKIFLPSEFPKNPKSMLIFVLPKVKSCLDIAYVTLIRITMIFYG